MRGEGQRAAFGGEQFGGGVAALAVFVSGEKRNGVLRGEDPVGEVLEARAVDRQPVRDGLAQGLEQVAAVEGGGVSVTPAEQLGLQCGDVGCRGCAMPASSRTTTSPG